MTVKEVHFAAQPSQSAPIQTYRGVVESMAMSSLIVRGLQRSSVKVAVPPDIVMVIEYVASVLHQMDVEVICE